MMRLCTIDNIFFSIIDNNCFSLFFFSSCTLYFFKKSFRSIRSRCTQLVDLTHANETKKNTSIDSIFFSPKNGGDFFGGLFYSNRMTATDRLVTLSTTVKKPMKLFLMSGLERDRALLPTPIGSTQHSKFLTGWDIVYLPLDSADNSATSGRNQNSTRWFCAPLLLVPTTTWSWKCWFF